VNDKHANGEKYRRRGGKYENSANINAEVVNMDTPRNTYTEVAIVRIMRNIHAEVAHVDTARNIYTEVATMATVVSIHAVVANSRFFRCVHVCEHCVDLSHCCHLCPSVYMFLAVSMFATPSKEVTYMDTARNKYATSV